MKPMFKYYGPAILWALFIFTMCTIKLSDEGNSYLFFPGFDKLVHCGFFFVMVVFCCYGLIRRSGFISYGAVIIIMFISILYGGIIELLQNYVFTWRDGDWSDLFSDSVGAAMAAFGVSVVVYGISYAKK